MIVTITVLLVILFLFAIVGGLYFINLLINPKNNMNGDTKAKALDVFVYLGIGITLVVSVYNLLQILFTAIDRKFVDVLSPIYVDSYNSDMRMAIALLVVMFPLYMYLSWYTARDIAKFLYKRDLTIRKIMIYLTIFVTVCSIIGTVVSIIYTYLGGELSVRFAYKAVSVFVVSLGVFGYYFYSIRRNYSVKSYIPAIAIVVSAVVVITSIVWSISIVGTPSEMRAKRLDGTRLSNISGIQQQILNRIQNTDKLPLKLDELNDPILGYSVPTDPITNVSYGYKVVQQPVMKFNYTTSKNEMATNAIFELCANFETVRNINNNGVGIVNSPKSFGLSSVDMSYSVSNYYYEGEQTPFWNHNIGETCFKRIISPEMYYGR